MDTKSLTQIVIVGGGYGGMMAALRLSGKLKKQPVDITLLDGATALRERIRFHQVATGQSVKQHTYDDLLRGTNVQIRQGWVTAIDPDAQTVTYQDANRVQSITYDYLVYAAGSRINLDAVPGIREHALSLTDLRASEALRDTITHNGRVVVAGGGLTAIELASELAESHPDLRVSLVTRGVFAGDFSRKGQAHIRRRFDSLGIEVLEHNEISRISSGQVERVNGDAIPFDTCVWVGGFVASELASQSGLVVNAINQLKVDNTLRVPEYPNIYGVGDAAYMDSSLRMACATSMPMGAYAGDHLAAAIQGEPEPEPFSLAYVLWCVSLGRKDGIVQYVHADDTPKEAITTGWAGATIKENVCKYTIWMLRLERLFTGAYWWPKVNSSTEAETPRSEAHVSSRHI